MKEYAISQGVPKKAIFIEDESQDTVGNVYYLFLKYLYPKNWRDIIIVTSGFHLARAEFIFKLILKRGFAMESTSGKNPFIHERASV